MGRRHCRRRPRCDRSDGGPGVCQRHERSAAEQHQRRLVVRIFSAMKTELFIALLAVTVMAACEREKREFHQSGVVPDTTPVTELYPGGGQPHAAERSKYEGNAYALSQGKMLFSSYNCSGCHANAGAGMGPAL